MEDVDIRNFNSNNLKDLEELREIIDDRIGALKGEESLKNHKGYNSDEVKEYLQKCLKR